MTKRSDKAVDLDRDQGLLRAQLAERARKLNGREAKVVLEFLEELVVFYDPDVVHDFMQWRKDPRLVSLLQLAARLSDEMRDQLLFFAEDLFASEQTKH